MKWVVVDNSSGLKRDIQLVELTLRVLVLSGSQENERGGFPTVFMWWLHANRKKLGLLLGLIPSRLFAAAPPRPPMGMRIAGTTTGKGNRIRAPAPPSLACAHPATASAGGVA